MNDFQIDFSDKLQKEAFYEGKEAFGLSQPLDENPYDALDDDLYQSWRIGWYSARKNS